MNTLYSKNIRHSKQRLVFTIIILIFIKLNLNAQTVLIISSDKDRYVFNEYLEYFEDLDQKATFSEIKEKNSNISFKKLTSSTPSFGYTNSAIWIRFRLKRDKNDKSDEIYLDIDNVNLQYVTAYIPHNNNYKEYKTGSLLPLSTRNIINRHFVFTISLPNDSIKTIYLRFVNGNAMAIPMKLIKPKAFDKQEIDDSIVFGFIYGALIILLIYNIFIFLSFKQDYYFKYIILIFSFLLFNIEYNGYGNLYLWKDNYFLQFYLLPVSLILVITSFISFMDKFFNLKKVDLIKHKIIKNSILLLLTIPFLIPIIGYKNAILIILILDLLNVFFSFYIVYFMWKRGVKESRYFLLAWFWLGLGTIITISTRFAVIEQTYFSINSYQYGMLLMILFFSLALADKFNLIQKRTDKVNLELEESEKRFKKLANLTLEGILIHKDGLCIDCNDPFLKMFLYKRKNVINKNISELGFFQNEKNVYENYFIEEKNEPQKINCTNKNGAKLALMIETRKINENDNIFVTTFRNISESQRSQILNDVLTNIGTAINFTDDLKDLNNILKEELNVLFDTSDFYVALFENGKFYISGKNIENRIVDSIICDYISNVNKAVIFKENDFKKCVDEEKLKLKENLPKVWMGVPFYINKELKGIIALQNEKSETTYTNSDLSLLEFISRQVSEEIKRKQNEDQIRTLNISVEQSPASIVITDTDGNIEYVNPAFEKTTGYTKKEATGENPRVLKSGKLSEQVYTDLWNTISSGKEWRGEFLNKKKNGEFYWESAVISPVFDSKGQIKHYMAIKEDVTEQKMLQYQLRQSQKMDSLGKLAGGVAHDFNNLLTVINGFSEIALQKAEENESIYRDITSIHSAGKKAEILVRQLLSFSSLQSYEPEIININKIITNLNKMMRRLISEDIHIDINLDEQLPLVQGNDGQIEQVLINLIVNARDAINQKTKNSYEKEIKIITTVCNITEDDVKGFQNIQTGEYVLLKIVDNGIGMEEDVSNKIFEPFYTTKERGKGTGLGLATVYGIVKQGGGWIDVSSLLGVGTTFKVYWPITEKIKENFEDNSEKQEYYLTGGNETILLVEDDADVRELVQSALENYGYKVNTAVDGLKGLEFVENESVVIDLMVTDMIMPNLNGKELSEKALKIRPDLKILYTSGYTDDQLVTNGEMASEIDFLQKPYSVVILLKKVREILDRVKI